MPGANARRLPPDHGTNVSAAAMRLAPAFRTERARLAGKASNSNAAIIRRFINRLPELTPAQLETVRRALPPDVKTDAS